MVRQNSIRQTTASKQDLLLIVCGDVKSNLGPILYKRVRVFFSNIRGLCANLDKLAVARSNYDVWFLLSLKSLIATISQSYVSLDLVVHSRGFRTPLLVPQKWHFLLGKDSIPSGRASWSVLVMNPVCFVFAVG